MQITNRLFLRSGNTTRPIKCWSSCRGSHLATNIADACPEFLIFTFSVAPRRQPPALPAVFLLATNGKAALRRPLQTLIVSLLLRSERLPPTPPRQIADETEAAGEERQCGRERCQLNIVEFYVLEGSSTGRTEKD